MSNNGEIKELLSDLMGLDDRIKRVRRLLELIKTDLKIREHYDVFFVIDNQEIYRHLFPLEDDTYKSDPNRFFVEAFATDYLFKENVFKKVLIPPYAGEFNSALNRIRADAEFVTDAEYYTLHRFYERLVSEKPIDRVLKGIEEGEKLVEDDLAKSAFGATKQYFVQFVMKEIKKQKIFEGLKEFNRLLECKSLLPLSDIVQKDIIEGAASDSERYRYFLDKTTAVRPSAKPSNKVDSLACTYMENLNNSSSSNKSAYYIVSSSHKIHNVFQEISIEVEIEGRPTKTSVLRDLSYFLMWLYVDGAIHRIDDIEALINNYLEKTHEFYTQILKTLFDGRQIPEELLNEVRKVNEAVKNKLDDFEQFPFSRVGYKKMVERIGQKLQQRATKGASWELYIEGLQEIQSESGLFSEHLQGIVDSLRDDAQHYMLALSQLSAMALSEKVNMYPQHDLISGISPIDNSNAEKVEMFNKILGALEINTSDSKDDAKRMFRDFEHTYGIDDDDVRLMNAKIIKNEGQFSKAVENLTDLIDRHPQHSDLHFEISIAYRRWAEKSFSSKKRAGELLELATQSISAARDLSPDNPKYLRESAFQYWQNYRLYKLDDMSVEFLDSAIELANSALKLSAERGQRAVEMVASNDAAYYIALRGDVLKSSERIDEAWILMESCFDIQKELAKPDRDSYLETAAFIKMLQAEANSAQAEPLLHEALSFVYKAFEINPSDPVNTETLKRITQLIQAQVAKPNP